MPIHFRFVLLVLALPSVVVCGEDNWPRFRGAAGTGVAEDDPRLPDSWSKTDNVKWVADVPGWGWSGPIVWGKKLFVTSVISDEEHPFIHWYQPKAGPYSTSPIVYGDYYYTLMDRGFLTCHDARTGEEIYGKTRFPVGASFTSSPWAYNGRIFCLSEDGDTFVVQAGPEFKVIGTNRLEELCMASPAVAQGKLLLRTASKLYCIGK